VLSLVPFRAPPFLSYSDLASVRANEVLDDLTIPGYGHSTSSSIQLEVVVFNARKHPIAEGNHAVQHEFPVPGQFERLLDSDEAAALLGIHKKTLQRMHAAERSPASKLGIFGAFVRPLSTIGSLQDSPGSPKTA
jgi:hypothetical protein